MHFYPPIFNRAEACFFMEVKGGKMRKQTAQVLLLAGIVFLFAAHLALAYDFNQSVSSQNQATFNQILQPVMNIYNLVKYAASAIAGMALLFAGVTYMTSGSDPRKRDNAKNMAMYVVIGLVIIWAAPFVVNLIVA